MVESEEVAIFQLSKKYGKKWSKIASMLPGRSENAIKNYFYSTVRKNIRMINKKLIFREKLVGPIREILSISRVAELVCCPFKDSEDRVNAIRNGMAENSENTLAQQTVEIKTSSHAGETGNNGELANQYQFGEEYYIRTLQYNHAVLQLFSYIINY